jgi:hypothetical protein
MSFIRTAIRSGLALKAARLIQREMSKPENQRRAKELIGKVAQRRRSAVVTQKRSPGTRTPRR